MFILKLKQFARKVSLTAASLASVFAANSAMAVDDAAVKAAYEAGTASVNGAVVGLIGLIAVIVGVGAVISLMKRGYPI